MTGFVEVSQNEMMVVDGGIGIPPILVEVIKEVTVALIVNTITILGSMLDTAIENASSNSSNSSGGISNGGTYIDTAYTPSGTYA
ncbi:MAG: hypothetical protein KA785_07080 [Spirochaetaceae bacterium]|nr:hypothetical protein [Spirochaetaceae bacterium]